MNTGKLFTLSQWIGLSFILPFTTAVADHGPSAIEQPQLISNKFTGRVTSNKVRLRTGPDLDSAVIRELDQGSLLLVTDEKGDFFAVLPPNDLKAYIYRSYIIDNMVGANRVNVRLAPNLEAVIIAQFNSGDPVKGKIYENDNRWLEIPIPETARLWISKDYLEKAGDAGYFVQNEMNRHAFEQQLQQAKAQIAEQMVQSYDAIDLNETFDNLEKVGREATEFPMYQMQAKQLLASTKEALLKLKLDYLENHSIAGSILLKEEQEKLIQEMQIQRNRVTELEQELQAAQAKKEHAVTYNEWMQERNPALINAKMSAWIPKEVEVFDSWHQQQEGTIDDFYAEEDKNAVQLHGVVDNYDRTIFNKPGDFILLNRLTRQPVAYLYSTQVNLQPYIGQEVTLSGVKRPNNHFAFPAYFVISVE